MKKVLIASTALVAAGLMTTGTASAAEKIKLNLGGFSKWWIVAAEQDSTYEAVTTTQRGAASNVDVKGDNEIFFGGETTLDNGLKVGVQIELEAGGMHHSTATNGGTSTTGAGDVIDESYIWIAGGFGKLIVGSENNGTYLLHVQAPDAAGNWGEGGILSGGYAVVQPSSVASIGAIANASGLRGANTTAIATDGDADKITYVAPSFYGLTVGASYVPNVLSEDDARMSSNNGVVINGAYDKSVDALGAGALYGNTFGGVGVKVSAGYVTYDAGAEANQHRSHEWSAGTQLSYAGFTLGGSYRHMGWDQGTDSANHQFNADGHAWDIGLSYASGPWAVSAAYFQSSVEDSTTVASNDTVTIYQASGKYALGPGVDVLGTVGYGKFDDESIKTSGTDTNHNSGWTVMTGVSLAF